MTPTFRRIPMRLAAALPAVFAVFAMSATPLAHAQTFPAHALKMIVGASPGGGSDGLARPLAAQLALDLKQPVVVENRAGAGGIIGSKATAVSPADGYTMAFITDAHTVSASLQKTRPYDPVKDFTPIGMVGYSPLILMVSKKTGITTFAQFLDKARSASGGLSYGSSGVGGNLHIATAQLSSKAGISMLHVPFKSGGDALQELLAGRIDVLLAAPTNSVPYQNDPRVTLVAVTSATPLKVMPRLPTIQSTGLDFQYATAIALVGPAGIPAPIVAQLNAALNRVLVQPEMTKVLDSQLVTAAPGSPDVLKTKLTKDMQDIGEALAAGQLKLLD
ncbi:Bug family tripartite tricarboxylate transporter substrate binding protein [Pigmentiphaga litoralis]|uniref:Tripartite-type tricarboxylate transporter receptor subunit TctC n=1 Tax=Pigmentiphaga litoralis TaxID=516702 RepID=A0A7Y9LM38_9BURK|nr:tripartite tricarboxylate transporter substrate-binding protein [Pigmentiphaga litoralis]NYE23178.1 tripartite-type tricarboxylate transporter receptor subunit TctC [Pigmentiphaga litoralis]NYE83207.1 tripartite-type tricarboxylate transporter receptor subunit TctC [Pigmentiphaga litoralis]